MARAVYYTELQKVVNGVLAPASNASAEIFEAGTTTPIIATMYAGPTGSTTLSNPLTADAEGSIQFFLDLPQAIKVVATATGLGTVTVDHQLVLVDQSADLVTLTGTQTLTNKTLTAPTFTGQATFANGSAAAPSIMIGTTPGFYRSGAGRFGLVGGTATVAEWDANATPGGPRLYISESALTKTALLLGRGGPSSGIVPDASYPSLMLAQSYQSEGGEAVKGTVYAVGHQASEGLMTGVQGLVEATSGGSWSPPYADADQGGPGTDPDPGYGDVYGFIGVLGNAQSYEDGGRMWGGNFIARQFTNDASALIGVEIDVESRAGATVQDRYGIIVVTTSQGANAGTNEDIALKFANKNTTEANRWADAMISFSSPNDSGGAGWPLQAGGTLIKAYDPDASGVAATDGIDLSVVTFSGYSLKLPNLVVNQTGRLGVRTTAVDGTAPLRMNCDSDSFLMVLDNTSGILAGGAGTGADRYLKIKFGAETVIFAGKVA